MTTKDSEPTARSHNVFYIAAFSGRRKLSINHVTDISN